MKTQHKQQAAPQEVTEKLTLYNWTDSVACKERIRVVPDIGEWDKSSLRDNETLALEEAIAAWRYNKRSKITAMNELARLVASLQSVMLSLEKKKSKSVNRRAISNLLRGVHQLKKTFWEWTREEWAQVADEAGQARLLTYAICYLLTGQNSWAKASRPVSLWIIAKAIHGEALRVLADEINKHLYTLGYSKAEAKQGREKSNLAIETALAEISLRLPNGDINLLNTALLEDVRGGKEVPKHVRQTIYRMSVGLHALKHIAHPLRKATGEKTKEHSLEDSQKGVPAEWVSVIERWAKTSTLEPASKKNVRMRMLQVGRWLAVNHPTVTSPEQWTSEIAADYVAACLQWKVGDYSITKHDHVEVGKPLTPNGISCRLSSATTFFKDVKRWKWHKCENIDPVIDFELPKSVKSKRGHNPRDIKQSVWMKLVWASLNLTEEDLSWEEEANVSQKSRSALKSTTYPLELVRAMAILWTHAGLRSNELLRLRVGCIRDVTAETDAELMSELNGEMKDLICLLDVPINKTSSAFTKPVGKAVKDAVVKWEKVRPSQAPVVEEKTGENVHYLFSHKGQKVNYVFLNNTLLSILCRKAGVPEEDAPGKSITTHRGRASAATWYLNTREGMTLEELMRWLGHKSISSTQHYARPSPAKQMKAFAKAHANSYMVEMLVDKDAILSGTAAQGEPWQYYALGNGYFCSNPFYSKCAHRMACAKCDFYVPAEVQLASFLQAKGNLEKMYSEMPLDEDEKLAVTGGIEAMKRLVEKLKDVPTPCKKESGMKYLPVINIQR